MTHVDREPRPATTPAGAHPAPVGTGQLAPETIPEQPDGSDGLTPGAATCSCQMNVADWYHRYAQHIRQFTLSYTGEPSLADDCTSETFLRALTHRHSFQCRDAGVQPWLFTIARNIVRDHHKSARCRYEIPTDTMPDNNDPATNPEQAVLRHEAVADLHGLLEQLTADQATCLRLRFFEQYSVQETAQAMGRDERAVRSLQHRAIRSLAPLVLAQRVTAQDRRLVAH